MKVKDLLKQEKGKYTTFTLIREKNGTLCIPWTYSGKEWKEIEVKEYYYNNYESVKLDKYLDFKNTKQEKELIIIWEKK